MKNIFVLFIFLSSFSLFGQVPSFEWAKRIGGPNGGSNDSTADAIAIDKLGNIYITGDFSDLADFDPGPDVFNLTATSTVDFISPDIFVAKYSSDGEFLWAVDFGSIETDYGRAIATDTFGNVYITGVFQGTVDFDPGAETHTLSGPLNSFSHFILKLDTNGSFVWVREMEGFGSGGSFAVDVASNVYMTGVFSSTVDFDLGSNVYNLTASGDSDAFILKLNSDGGFEWVKGMGGDNSTFGNAITIDGFNNIYTIGTFSGEVDFDPGVAETTLTATGINDMFVSKLNGNGDFIWARTMGGGGSSQVIGGNIKVDDMGAVYASGGFTESADFDPGPGIFDLVSAGSSDAFFLKLDFDGNFVWAKTIGGEGLEGGAGLVLDRNKNTYAAGTFRGTVDFDPGLDSQLISSPAIDIQNTYLLKLDSEGNYVWAGSFFGNSRNRSNSIVLDSHDNIYTAGYFRNTVDFNPVDTNNYELTAASGNLNIFIHKMSQQTCTTNSDTTHLTLTSCDPMEVGIIESIHPDQNGCDSIVIETTTLISVPETPIAPTDLVIEENAPPFQITIPEILNATSYSWQVPPGVQILSGANTNSITINWDDQITSGTVCVSAVNECGSSPADCMEITVDIIDGVKDVKNKDYSIFPNPADALLNIVFDSDGLYEIVLLDVLGREVIPSTIYTGQAKIEIMELASGTYWMKISKDGDAFWERVEIIR